MRRQSRTNQISDPLDLGTFCRRQRSAGGGGGGGGSGGGGDCCCSLNLLTAGYRSRVTGGAGGVSLRAAGEQDTHIAHYISRVVPRVSFTII